MTRVHRYRSLFGLFAVFCCGVITASAQLGAGQVFGDVATGDADYPATTALFQLGIIKGCDNVPDFCPKASLLRQDMAAFIVRAWSARIWNDPDAFQTQTAKNSVPYFSDVGTDNQQFVYIQKLYELGITAGTTAPTFTNGVLTPGLFSPGDTLVNYQIAVFLARARNLADNGCTAGYYTTAEPFPVSGNPNCAQNGFPSNAAEAQYFTDVCSPANCPKNMPDPYFPFIQRLGDLGVFEKPSTVLGYAGCTNCIFGENTAMSRPQMAIWTVSGMGLQPESVLSMNPPGVGGGSNVFSTLPTITVGFTFTLFNQTGASIEYGQFLLSNTSGDTVQAPVYCSGAWATADLKLYDATPAETLQYNQPLADTFCTVSLVSVVPLSNPSGVQATVNFTFAPSAQGATYNVFHDVVYSQGQDPWENVGTLTVQTPPSLSVQPTVTLVDNTQSSGSFFVGDSFTLTVTGPSTSPGLPVSVVINGVDYGPVNSLTGGVYATTRRWTLTDAGSYSETWYVNGVQAGQTLQFAVYGPQDPPPVSYPNYLTSLPQPTAACNVTGTWADTADSPAFETWTLTQPDATVSGTLVASAPPFGTVTWQVSGSVAAGVVTLHAGSPSPATNNGGKPVASSISAVFTLSSGCVSGSTDEVATYPSGAQHSQGGSDAFVSAATQRVEIFGTATLNSRLLTFTVSPAPVILTSTGDTNVNITTTASNSSYTISNGTYYSYASPQNPFSSCLAAVNLPYVSGVGSASGALTTSPPASCSGIYTIGALAGATISGNLTYVVVPPQVLMEGLYGEAHSQSAVYGLNDPTEEALGVTLRNRFSDAVWFGGSTTYQNTITPQQVQGLNTSLTSWTNSDGSPTAELVHAANVFDGSSTVSVANAKCFFTPTTTGWGLIQAALASGTTVLPRVTADPGCFKANEQFVYKASISLNADRRGAPAFIFVQWRNPTDAAVIQIP